MRFGPRSIFLASNGTRLENGTRPVDEIFGKRHHDLMRRNVTSTSNVTVKNGSRLVHVDV